MGFKEYVESLKKIIEDGKSFHMKFYVIDDDIEHRVEAALNMIMAKFDRIETAGVLYTCVKELMINATKANLKRILFEKNTLDIDNEDEYIEGMLEFRNALNDESYLSYLKELKAKDYWVSIRFEYCKDGIHLNVINNAHISPIENQRLREKLKRAMGYDNIAEFYLDQGDEIEGAGMGIALIVMLLKGMEIDPALFRIGNTNDNKTFARLEVPLTENFVSYREKNKKPSL